MVPPTHLPGTYPLTQSVTGSSGMRSRGRAWALGPAGSPSSHGAVPTSQQPRDVWGTFMESGRHLCIAEEDTVTEQLPYAIPRALPTC